MADRARTVKKLAAEELFQYGVALLARRALSVGEVRTRLTRKAADPEDVAPAIARLREYGFLDDARFAEGFASARRDSGAFGAARVMRDLRQRRVAAPVAEKAVGSAFENVDEEAAVSSWIERKLRGKELAVFLNDPKNLASVYRRLRYAGFSSSPAIKVLKRYASAADELEDTSD